MNKFLISAFIVVAANFNQKAISQEDNIIKDSITSQLLNLHKTTQINGFAVAIVDSNGTLYQNGFGFADRATQKAYTNTTIQNIASISKTLIGISLMKAQELGHLDLDDSINKYLPFEVINPYHKNKPITIRHLATHTSSIQDKTAYNNSYVFKDNLETIEANFIKVPKGFNPNDSNMSLDQFLENYLGKKGEWYKKQHFTKKKPGTSFEYSNVAATLAAYVIEKATGTPFNEFSKKYILDPLGMNRSGWKFEEIEFSQYTTLYSNQETAYPAYSLITYPDGGFLTTIEELGFYLTELMKGYRSEGTLLSKESYAEFFKQQLSTDVFEELDAENPYNDEYNSGIFMGFSGTGLVGHTGGDPGVASFMFFDPEKDIGRIIMTNTDFNNQNDVDTFFTIYNKLDEYGENLKNQP